MDEEISAKFQISVRLAIAVFMFTFLEIPIGRAAVSDTIKTAHFGIYSGYAQYGNVLATNPFLKQAITDGDRHIEFAAFSLQYLKQTNGEKEWEKNFNYPTYGLGIYSAKFFDNSGFGTPIAIYGVLKAPFRRWGKLSLNWDTGFGLTFNWKSFNPAANNFDISLGARETVFIDLGINLKYRLNDQLDLSLGYSFTHFSNGALKVPNFGLNTFSPKISLEYNLQRFIPPAKEFPTAPFPKYTSLDFSFFGGIKNVVYNGSSPDSVNKYKGVYYQVYGMNTTLNRQLTRKSKIGIGCSISYDGSYNSTAYIDHGELEPVEGFHKDKFSLSIYPSYELVIYRLSVVVQPGFYLFRQQSVDKKPVPYQRLGLHYQLGSNLFTGVCLRAYDYHVSDFIEWTLGYHLDLIRRQ
jgi:Lipid A 3-O-deacylase (PagL)